MLLRYRFYKVNVIITRMGDRFIVACIIRDENGMLVDPLGHIVKFPYKEENVCLVAFQAMQAGVAYFLKRVPGKTKLLVECDNRNAVSMYEEPRPAIPVKFRETYWYCFCTNMDFGCLFLHLEIHTFSVYFVT